MTDPLDALEALIAAATPGPWKVRRQAWAIACANPKIGNVALAPPYNQKRIARDFRLIVAAVNALPGLLARLRAAEAERDALKPYAQHYPHCIAARYAFDATNSCSCGLDAAKGAAR